MTAAMMPHVCILATLSNAAPEVPLKMYAGILPAGHPLIQSILKAVIPATSIQLDIPNSATCTGKMNVQGMPSNHSSSEFRASEIRLHMATDPLSCTKSLRIPGTYYSLKLKLRSSIYSTLCDRCKQQQVDDRTLACSARGASSRRRFVRGAAAAVAASAKPRPSVVCM